MYSTLLGIAINIYINYLSTINVRIFIVNTLNNTIILLLILFNKKLQLIEKFIIIFGFTGLFTMLFKISPN